MRIIDGKWRDQYGEPINTFNYNEVKEIASNLTNLYGKDITYNRIELVSALKSLTPKQENDLAFVLNNSNMISKLAKY